MIALLIAVAARANAVSDAADKLDQGDVDGAIATLDQAAQSGPPSAAVMYDLGEAYYKKGDNPRAIAWFRAAHELRPRDPDTVHNLALARSLVTGVPDPVDAPAGWLEFATPGELGLLSVGMVLAASIGAVRRRPGQGALWAVVGGLGVAGGIVAWDGWRDLRDGPVAVIVDQDANLRDAPRADAGDVGRALAPGAEVAVERDLSGFLLVHTGDGRRGWIPDDAALIASPAARSPG